MCSGILWFSEGVRIQKTKIIQGNKSFFKKTRFFIKVGMRCSTVLWRSGWSTRKGFLEGTPVMDLGGWSGTYPYEACGELYSRWLKNICRYLETLSSVEFFRNVVAETIIFFLTNKIPFLLFLATVCWKHTHPHVYTHIHTYLQGFVSTKCVLDEGHDS